MSKGVPIVTYANRPIAHYSYRDFASYRSHEVDRLNEATLDLNHAKAASRAAWATYHAMKPGRERDLAGDRASLLANDARRLETAWEAAWDAAVRSA